ncbi:MAG: hypothetical protein RSC56_08315 [Acidaminococcaceae bacterium]
MLSSWVHLLTYSPASDKLTASKALSLLGNKSPGLPVFVVAGVELTLAPEPVSGVNRPLKESAFCLLLTICPFILPFYCETMEIIE